MKISRRFFAVLTGGLVLLLLAPNIAWSQDERLNYTIQQFASGGFHTNLSLADMDYDGTPEVLIGNRGTSRLEIWQYDGNLETLVQIDSSLALPYHVHDSKAADFDRDGDMDVAVGTRSYGLYYATNTGAPGTVGSWSVQRLDSRYSWQVLVEDFDGDGNLDIFHCVDYGPINTFYGDGHGNFVQGISVSDPVTSMRTPLGFNAVDLNGDGRLDLIGLDAVYLRAFLNPDDRTSAWDSVGPTTAFGDTGNHFVLSQVGSSAGDLDGNGYVDQVANRANSPSGDNEVLLFTGSMSGGTLQWTRTVVDMIEGIGYAYHAGVADLDGDGNLDIHVGGGAKFTGLYTYLGDGHGGFTTEFVPLDHGIGGANSVAIGDLNGDGTNDIVTSRIKTTGQNDGFEVLFGQGQRPPVAADDEYTTDEDVMLNVGAPGVLGNDADPDEDALTAIVDDDPEHGTLTLYGDGSFTYMPAANYNGVDSFTYMANDGHADSNVATVSITVNPVNDPPVAWWTQEPNPTVTLAAAVTTGASFGDVDTGDSHTCTFDWGDGSPPETSSCSPGTHVSASHVYAGVGTYAVTFTVTDSGTASATATAALAVLYDFTGFFPPVDNVPIVNDANAGQAIPVKFSLAGDHGLEIFAAGYPLSASYACFSGTPTEAVEQTVTAGSSSLNYDPFEDQYVYVWKTDKSWAGTCRQLILQLNDGSDHVAHFQFKGKKMGGILSDEASEHPLRVFLPVVTK